MKRKYRVSMDIVTPDRDKHLVVYNRDGEWREVANTSIRAALVTIGANHSLVDFEVTVEDWES